MPPSTTVTLTQPVDGPVQLLLGRLAIEPVIKFAAAPEVVLRVSGGNRRDRAASGDGLQLAGIVRDGASKGLTVEVGDGANEVVVRHASGPEVPDGAAFIYGTNKNPVYFLRRGGATVIAEPGRMKHTGRLPFGRGYRASRDDQLIDALMQAGAERVIVNGVDVTDVIKSGGSTTVDEVRAEVTVPIGTEIVRDRDFGAGPQQSMTV